jgi:hypothetical protein
MTRLAKPARVERIIANAAGFATAGFPDVEPGFQKPIGKLRNGFDYSSLSKR